MIIIGEKINSSINTIRPLMEQFDMKAIQKIAKKQVESGASYIDVNSSIFYKNEPEMLEWVVKTVQEVTDLPLAIDSNNSKAIERALKVYENRKNSKPMVNSITGEKEKIDSILPLVKEYDTSVIALCMDDTGVPETIDDRFFIAKKLIEILTKANVCKEDIFIDPLIQPIATGSHYGKIAIETIRKVKKEFPGVNTVCGLSNISYGMPVRKLLNRACLVATAAAGLDGVILDPTDKELMSFVYAAEALMGTDNFCINYITKFKEGQLKY